MPEWVDLEKIRTAHRAASRLPLERPVSFLALFCTELVGLEPALGTAIENSL